MLMAVIGSQHSKTHRGPGFQRTAVSQGLLRELGFAASQISRSASVWDPRLSLTIDTNKDDCCSRASACAGELTDGYHSTSPIDGSEKGRDVELELATPHPRRNFSPGMLRWEGEIVGA